MDKLPDKQREWLRTYEPDTMRYIIALEAAARKLERVRELSGEAWRRSPCLSESGFCSFVRDLRAILDTAGTEE